MAAIDDTPVLSAVPAVPEYFDEKVSVTKERVFTDTGSDVGEVCEDIRAIDMDAEGKEKPIETASDWSTRLISLHDDPTLPVWTFRLWFLSLGLAAFGAGEILEEIIPGPGHKRFKVSDNAFWRFMNPGPFNMQVPCSTKENVGILIMAAASTHGALAINIFAADDLYYGIKPNPAVAIFTLLGSQLVGYGLAGMMRSFLVYPTYCVFPNLVPTIQMFDVLFRNQDSILQRKRIKFFWTLFIGIFIWEWFPEYIAPTLTGVSIFCLARQKSPWVTRLFGGAAGNEGLGLFSICWTGTTLVRSPGLCNVFDADLCIGSGGSAYGALFQPLSTQLSLFAGVLICMSVAILFYENGTAYNQDLILNDDFSLNLEKLEVQGLPWFSATYTIAKIGGSLSFGATVTHMILWNGKQVWEALKTGQRGECQDPHYLKMKVPFWWYAGIFVASLAMGLATNYTSMLAAGLVPGKPQANMYFTLYAYNSTEQGRSMTRDLKMGASTGIQTGTFLTMPLIGQYTKLPPRVTEILLSVQGTNTWSGAGVQSFNSDAVAWGALAKQLYSPGSTYGIVPLSIIIGLFVPIPFWILHRYYPNAHFDGVITPMICSEIGYLSGGINSSVFMTFLLCIFSQYYLRKYRPGFFRKYNFLMSAALDGGTEVMTFVYSFAVGGAGGKTVSFPQWGLNPAGNPDYCMRLT
ncbi:OPT oligopeptide transporter protein-domain-containing protein [Mycena sp. CBHHK59/15]|nr:OPT oligopeptide transporter protein-domain-containing protein [Mycena sp. CBHHK59/15]